MDEAGLREIDERVMDLLALVSGGIGTATTAFLDNDRETARALVASDLSIDCLQSEAEALVHEQLSSLLGHLDAPVRELVSLLLIIPELERSGDLVEHIALRTPQALADQISPRARAIVAEMGRIATEMWQEATRAYLDRDPTAATLLRAADDELDDLHVQLSVELAQPGMSPAVAVEMSLVARFYERLGDHAVNIARRVRQLVAMHDRALRVEVAR